MRPRPPPLSASIGHLGGSKGDVYVSGVGSTWAMKDDLSIGEQGSGTLSISNKGTVSNSYGTIGNYASGSGSVTINGVGSTWTNRNDLVVGKSGTGYLTVIEGGKVASSSVTLASMPRIPAPPPSMAAAPAGRTQPACMSATREQGHSILSLAAWSRAPTGLSEKTMAA